VPPPRPRRLAATPRARTSEVDRADDVVIASDLVDGMGHGWPGGAPGLVSADPAGPDASELLWAFFVAHPRAAP
jgi:poly(3-hydroxybutyrate) depolymerase